MATDCKLRKKVEKLLIQQGKG